MSEENKFTFENEEYRHTYWHSCSHIMAQAVKRLWPEVKLAIGPAIKEGWYYDMLAPFAFTPEHMEQIEDEMRKICKEKLKIERFELPRDEALELMKDEPFKIELINDLPEGEAISFYKKYVKEAPGESGRYVLRYRIAARRGEPLGKRIAILEAYRHREFDEEWAYRLAEL